MFRSHRAHQRSVDRHRRKPHRVAGLYVDAVDPIDLRALSKDDARADGFDSLADMRRTLLEIYPEHKTDGRNWFRTVRGVGYAFAPPSD